MLKTAYIFTILCWMTFSADYAQQQNVKKIDSGTFQNLYQVNDSIYRGELPTSEGIHELTNLGVKSFLNLRFFRSDKRLTKETSIQTFHEPVNAWTMSEGEIIEALLMLKAAPKPMLVHCVHGSDRTGTIIAAYRIVFEGWTKEEALKEMLNPVYGFHSCFQNLIFLIEHLNVERVKRALNLP
jgi:tyrosine-protein phosphatase SIW14